MIERLRIPALLFAFALTALPSAAATTLSASPHGAEANFVVSAQQRLSALYPTADAAEKAGYIRYNNEDKTGAISYANTQWTASDLDHPSQLWYDVAGRLLGADYTRPYSVNGVKAPIPKMWGLDAKRWFKYPGHVHYVYKDAAGAMVYGHGMKTSKYVAAGGSVTDPQGQPLTTITPVKDAASITHVFVFPDMWDVELWVVPNPLGAFAEKNPLVHPSKDAKGEM
ncbi:MAG: hypothetical protein M3Y18_06070 [Candidatus Eremiobacteraeota bacterium]|nr:hypothetical protein [Candidatus Eremiobacteraeota bacterium]